MTLTSDTAPLVLFYILLASGAGAALASSVIALWFDGVIRGWEGVVALFGCGAFVSVTIVSAGTPRYPLMLVVVALAAIGAKFVARTSDRALERRFLDQDERNARGALRFDYKNTAAHSLLADVLCKRGRLREAIIEYEICLSLDMEQPAERRKLEKAVAELALEEGAETICPDCRARWPRGAGTCPECGRPRAGGRGALRWVASGGTETFVWAGVAVAAIAMLLWMVHFRVASLLAFGFAVWLGGLGLLARGLAAPRKRE